VPTIHHRARCEMVGMLSLCPPYGTSPLMLFSLLPLHEFLKQGWGFFGRISRFGGRWFGSCTLRIIVSLRALKLQESLQQFVGFPGCRLSRCSQCRSGNGNSKLRRIASRLWRCIQKQRNGHGDTDCRSNSANGEQHASWTAFAIELQLQRMPVGVGKGLLAHLIKTRPRGIRRQMVWACSCRVRSRGRFAAYRARLVVVWTMGDGMFVRTDETHLQYPSRCPNCIGIFLLLRSFQYGRNLSEEAASSHLQIVTIHQLQQDGW